MIGYVQCESNCASGPVIMGECSDYNVQVNMKCASRVMCE